MSDPRTATQTALVIDPAGKNPPAWELSAPVVAYPIEVDDGRTVFQLAVYLEPYAARDLKQALNEEKTGLEPSADGDLTQINRTFKEFFPLVEKHFKGLDGVASKGKPAAFEQQLAFFKANAQLKKLAVRFGWGDISTQIAAAPSGALDIDSIHDAHLQIPTRQNLWDPATGRVVRVDMIHSVRRQNQNQHSRAQSALREKVGKRGGMLSDINYDVLEVLYNESIISIDGMTIGGKPCAAENRDEFIPLVPLWHKSLVIREIYRENRIKN